MYSDAAPTHLQIFPTLSQLGTTLHRPKEEFHLLPEYKTVQNQLKKVPIQFDQLYKWLSNTV